MILTEEKRRTRRQNFTGATLSTTNHWDWPRSELDLRGERPGTSRPCRVASTLGRHRQLHVAIYRQNQRCLQTVELT
jgi:hypothetical protein